MVDRSASAQPTSDTASEEFTGEVFLVTGAAQGLGLEIATTAAARGAHVALCDLDGDKVRDAATEIERVHKVETIGHPCDVSDASAITRVVENVITAFVSTIS